ncbi:MAG: hypothetical protein HPY53_11595 [Brevinematales bacterium]|nr:hypothetical protein [Brevinematales bacterium]
MKKGLFFIAAMVIGLAGCQSGEKVLLRMNLKKGDVYNYISETRQKITQTVDKQAMEIEQTVVTEYEYYVEDVDAASNITCRITFKKMSIDMSMQGMSMKMSSDTNEVAADDASRVSSKMLNAMTDVPFIVKLNYLGDIIEVKNLEALFDKMTSSLAGLSGDSEQTGEQLSQSIKKMLSPDTIKEMMRQNFNAYPEKPMGVGDSWDNAMDVKSGFPMSIKMKNTITKLGPKTAEFLLDSTLKTSFGSNLIDLGGFSAGMDIVKGTQKGTYIIDLSTGMAISAEVDMDFDGIIKIGGEKPQEIPMSVIGKTTAKLK